MSILDLMAAPFAECLVLVAIHTYLGIHVLKRRVIFVDLALAQIAALGTTVGFLFGIMPETLGALVFSMAFTFVGAGVFSATRFRNEKVPQEAIIGLTYAVSCALAVLVVEKTRGAEHLKDILVGSLLWVTWSDVGTAAAVYLGVGLIHFWFRKNFLLISDRPDDASRAGLSVRAWDFLFYVTFGVVITLSTRVAGVLLVFVFLVAPAILAFLITDRLWLQLLIGWITGTFVTVAGLYLSWVLDLPSGPAVIVFYGVALILAGIGVLVVRASDRVRALRTVACGTAIAAVVGFAIWFGGKWIGGSGLATSEEALHTEHAVHEERSSVEMKRYKERQTRADSLKAKLKRCVGPHKVDRYLSFAGPEEQMQHIQNRLSLSKRKGLEFLLIAVSDPELPLFYREGALELLVQHAGEAFGYDPQREASENEQAVHRLCEHVKALKRGP